MKKTVLIFLSFILISYLPAKADVTKCKIYDVICKSKKAFKETKEFQKEAWKDIPAKKLITGNK
mgnify:CR=1 FL=1